MLEPKQRTCTISNTLMCERLDYSLMPKSSTLKPTSRAGMSLEPTNTGLQANGIQCSVTLADFKNGHLLFAFDLTPDRTPEDVHINLLHQGKLNFNLKFGTVLLDPVSIIIYSEYVNLIQLTQDRSPVTDFSMV